jgi:hypothetical protein
MAGCDYTLALCVVFTTANLASGAVKVQPRIAHPIGL